MNVMEESMLDSISRVATAVSMYVNGYSEDEVFKVTEMLKRDYKYYLSPVLEDQHRRNAPHRDRSVLYEWEEVRKDFFNSLMEEDEEDESI